MKQTPVGASITRPSNHANPIKKTLSLFLSLVMLLSITAGLDLSAYAATSGDFEYEILETAQQRLPGIPARLRT